MNTRNSDSIRRPLSALERLRLENQFNEQVPEFRQIGEQKRNALITSYGAGAVFGAALGSFVWKRYEDKSSCRVN